MKTFVLTFEDNTTSITNGATFEEINNLYLNETVRLDDRQLKKCIKVEDKEVFDLKHRLLMIKDDLEELINFIDEERMMERFEKPTRVSDSAWNLINNIDIATDLSSNESLTWKLFTK